MENFTLILSIIASSITIISFLTIKYFKYRKRLKEAYQAFPKDTEVISNAGNILNTKLLELMKSEIELGNEIHLDNFGLDLELVTPWLRDDVIENKAFIKEKLEIRSLIMNPQSEQLSPLIIKKKDSEDKLRGNIYEINILNSIEKAKSFSQIEVYKFDFTLKKYDLPPIFHGFMLNDKYLFLGFCEIKDGRLHGGASPYVLLTKNNDKKNSALSTHYFNFYNNWFEYYWKKSTLVVKIPK